MKAAPYRVLIVEDEPLIAMQLESLIHELGFIVVGPARDLESARKLLEDEEVDSAILDILLDGQSSLPIADELARSGRPWIFTTGFTSPDLESRYPGVPLVNKPFSFDHLAELVARMKPHCTAQAA